MRTPSRIEGVLDSLGKFCFGSGGLGDLLYLVGWMEELDCAGLPIVFWADNKKLIDASLFPLKKLKLISEANVIFQGWQTGLDGSVVTEFMSVVTHENFVTKGHVPDRFDYMNEWAKNYEKYTLANKRIAKLERPIARLFFDKLASDKKTVSLSVLGTDKSPYKKKYLDGAKTAQLINTLAEMDDVAEINLLGARDEELILRQDLLSVAGRDKISMKFGLHIETLFEVVGSSDIIISVDTWAKTFGWLCGKKDSTYVIAPLLDKSQVQDDPADNIFLRGLGFRRVVSPIEREEFLHKCF